MNKKFLVGILFFIIFSSFYAITSYAEEITENITILLNESNITKWLQFYQTKAILPNDFNKV